MLEATLAIVKPDATSKNIIGQMITQAENQDLKVVACKMVHLTRRQAEGFYYVHRRRSFHQKLAQFLSERPIVVMVLRGENAISRWLEIMGATEPSQAAEGTIRKIFGEDAERNCVHGSDSPQSAEFEIGYFFSGCELLSGDEPGE